MDEGSTRPAGTRKYRTSLALTRLVMLAAIGAAPLWVAYRPGDGLALGSLAEATATAVAPAASAVEAGGAAPGQGFTPISVAVILVLIALSAFYSGSEGAFFSLQSLRLRGMAEDGTLTGRYVAALMDHPSRLLTTILVANCIANVLIGVVLGSRMDVFFEQLLVGLPQGIYLDPKVAAYLLAVTTTTVILVLFGEITPKIVCVSAPERFARLFAVPLRFTDNLLAPIRDGCLAFTDFLFRVTRFSELRAAPFITDDELKSVLFSGEAQAVIKREDLQMIQGILEFTDANLCEILTPRPDVVALSEDVSVGEAIDKLRREEHSRMPLYRGSLDTITGILVMKDVLPCLARGDTNRPVKEFARPPYFVPEMMTVHQFVKDAQVRQTHLAVVVDEYGGTAGIVTLEDAMEQVVGDIFDEGEPDEHPYVKLDEGLYRVEGSISLDELSELIGRPIEDEEHETLSGYLMNQTGKILEQGDEVELDGVAFKVEDIEGKRASSVLVEVRREPVEEEASS